MRDGQRMMMTTMMMIKRLKKKKAKGERSGRKTILASRLGGQACGGEGSRSQGRGGGAPCSGEVPVLGARSSAPRPPLCTGRRQPRPPPSPPLPAAPRPSPPLPLPPTPPPARPRRLTALEPMTAAGGADLRPALASMQISRPAPMAARAARQSRLQTAACALTAPAEGSARAPPEGSRGKAEPQRCPLGCGPVRLLGNGFGGEGAAGPGRPQDLDTELQSGLGGSTRRNQAWSAGETRRASAWDTTHGTDPALTYLKRSGVLEALPRPCPAQGWGHH